MIELWIWIVISQHIYFLFCFYSSCWSIWTSFLPCSKAIDFLILQIPFSSLIMWCFRRISLKSLYLHFFLYLFFTYKNRFSQDSRFALCLSPCLTWHMETFWNLILLMAYEPSLNFQTSSGFSSWIHELKNDLPVLIFFMDFHEGFSVYCCRTQASDCTLSFLSHLDIFLWVFHHRHISSAVFFSAFPPLKVRTHIVLWAFIGLIVIFPFPARPSCSCEEKQRLPLLWQPLFFPQAFYLGCRLGRKDRVLLLVVWEVDISIVEVSSWFWQFHLA